MAKFQLRGERWRNWLQASQWLLAVALLVPAFTGTPFDAVYFVGFGLPLGTTIAAGVALWSRRVTGLLLAIGDLGALAYALALLLVDPWTQLQFAVPGGSATLIVLAALSLTGLLASFSGRLIPVSRPGTAATAIVVAPHAVLAILLVTEMLEATAEPHGYVGLAIPLFGGPVVFLLLGVIGWSLGAWVPLVVADALLAFWGLVRLMDAITRPSEPGDMAGISHALAWVLLAAAGGIAASRLQRSGRRPAES